MQPACRALVGIFRGAGTIGCPRAQIGYAARGSPRGRIMNKSSGLRRCIVLALSLSVFGCAKRSSIHQSTPQPNSPPPPDLATQSATNDRAEPVVEFIAQLGHGASVTGISISPNGKVAATASPDATVRVWNVDSGILLRQLPIGEQAFDVAILHDGWRAVVLAGYDVQLWDILHARRLAKFQTRTGTAYHVRLLHHADWVVLGNAVGGVELWDLTRLQRVRTLVEGHGPTQPGVTDLDVSADDRWLVAGIGDGTLKIVDLQSGKLVHDLTAHTRSVCAVRFSPDGATLTSFSSDKTIRQWETSTGVPLQSHEFKELIFAGALLPDNRAIVGFSGPIPKVVDLTTGQVVRELEPWPGVAAAGAAAVAVTPDGHRSVIGSHKGTVLFSKVDDGTPIHATANRRIGVASLALSPSGTELAAVYHGGAVNIWDTATGARVREIAALAADNSSCYVAYSNDGQRFVRLGYGSLNIWDARSGNLLQDIKPPVHLDTRALAVSPNNQLVAIAADRIAVFTLDGGRLIWTGPRNQNLGGLAFTADSSRLLAGTQGHGVTVHDAMNGAELLQLKGPYGTFDRVPFSMKIRCCSENQTGFSRGICNPEGQLDNTHGSRPT